MKSVVIYFLIFLNLSSDEQSRKEPLNLNLNLMKKKDEQEEAMLRKCIFLFDSN